MAESSDSTRGDPLEIETVIIKEECEDDFVDENDSDVNTDFDEASTSANTIQRALKTFSSGLRKRKLNDDDDPHISKPRTKFCENNRPPRCLFCFCEVNTNETVHSNELEKSYKVIFILKKMLKISTDDLVQYMTLTDGENPSKWVSMCDKCHAMVEKALKIDELIKMLERRLLYYADQVVEILKTSQKDQGKGINKRSKDILECGKQACRCNSSLSVTNGIRRHVASQSNKSPSSTSRIRNQNLKTKRVSVEKDRLKKNVKDHRISTEQSCTPLVSEPDLAEDSEYLESEADYFHQDVCSDADDAQNSDEDWVPEQRRKAEPAPYAIRYDDKARNPDFKEDLCEDTFECPLCPNLLLPEPMNLQQYVLHIVFHTDNPYQCTVCKIYHPDDAVKMKAHLSAFHNDMGDLEPSRLFFKPDIDLIKVYNCCICDLSFSCWKDRDEHVSSKHGIDIEKPVNCPNCDDQFVSMLEVKLHQALAHPEYARLSCMVCFEIFRRTVHSDVLDEAALAKHVKSMHPTLRIPYIRLCSLCGLPFKKRFGCGPYALNFHLKTFHAELANTSFLCTMCDQNYPTLMEHQQHLSTAHSQEVSIHENMTQAVALGEIKRTWPKLAIRCGLCDAGMSQHSKASQFNTELSLEEHLFETHKLKTRCASAFRLQNLLKRPNYRNPIKANEVDNLHQDTSSDIPVNSDDDSESEQGQNAAPCKMNYDESAKNFELKEELCYDTFECPLCPNLPLLEPMNLNQFVYHIVFHTDNPCQCKICKIYLPNDFSKMKDHLSKFHKDVDSRNSVVVFFKPDINLIKVYNCSDCDRTYSCWRERDLHASVEHRLEIEKPVKCPNCEDHFATLPEVKLHQALDHPEYARLSCIVCFETFRRSNFPDVLDDAALAKHISSVHHTLRIPSIRICTLCGLTFRKNYGSGCYGINFHLKTFHADLSNTSYRCTMCDLCFPTLSEHQQHLSTAHEVSISKNALNAKSVSLGAIKNTWPVFAIQCGLCNIDKKASHFNSEMNLEEHLSLNHRLKVEHTPPINLQNLIRTTKCRNRKKVNVNPTFKPESIHANTVDLKSECIDSCSSCPDIDPTEKHLFEHFKSVSRKSVQIVDPKKKQRWYLNPSSSCQDLICEDTYECPLCPNLPLLEPMNLYQFVHHLVFHTENPCQCTICHLYIPDDSAKMEKHFNKCHKEMDELEPSRIFIRPDVNLIKIYRCWKCDKSYSCRKDRDLHVSTEHEISEISKLVNCPNCNDDFVSLPEVKLHQALAHPEYAKLSCVACFEIFSNKKYPEYLDEAALVKHVSSKHPTFRIPCIRLCSLCGLSFEKRFASGCYGFNMHLKTFHAKLTDTSFICTLCVKSFSTLLEHQQHMNEVHSEQEVSFVKDLQSTQAIVLGEIEKTWPNFSIRCGLCDAEKMNNDVKAFQFNTEVRLEEHLLEKHKLSAQCAPSFRFQKLIRRPDRKYRRMVDIRPLPCSNPDPVEIPQGTFASVKSKPISAKTLDSKSESIYNCSSCPDITPMTFNEFIVHILFHWRQPYKCTAPACNWYLPNVTKLIDKHWWDYHSSLVSKIEVKFKTVEFSPPEIWECFNCDLKFSSSSERDQHEVCDHNIHNIMRKEVCSVCNNLFRNINEVRLHKALEHPEAAELCCTYCDEYCGVVSIEGVVFRNPQVVYDHLLKKHPTPGRPGARGRPSIIDVCTFCGEVFSQPQSLIRHFGEVHEVPKKKQAACIICHQQTDFKYLQRHMFWTHVEKARCDICNIEMRAQGLKVHKFKEHGIVKPGTKILNCDREGCDFKTIRLALYNIHMRKHANGDQRNCFCQYCGKAYKDRTHLKRHEKIHINADTKPYTCELCGKSFTVRPYLHTHHRVVHLKNWHYKSKKRTKTKVSRK